MAGRPSNEHAECDDVEPLHIAAPGSPVRAAADRKSNRSSESETRVVPRAADAARAHAVVPGAFGENPLSSPESVHRDSEIMERRKHQRIPYGAWVEDETQGGLSFYLARNISMGGLLLRSKGSPPAVGHRVRLRLVIENEARIVSVTGEVLRHAPGPDNEFAVEFTNLDETREEFLRELIDEAGRHGDPETDLHDRG